MPKHPASHKNESEKEFQRRTFPAKIKAVRAKATAALAADKAIGKGHKHLTVKQRGVHQTALKTVNRIEARLVKPSGGTKAQKISKKPKPKSTPASRRKLVETMTGTSVLKKRLQGVNELAKAGRK